jgi:hypothetical protein
MFGLLPRLASADYAGQMPAKKHDRESIIETLRNLAKRLGKDSLSKKEIATAISTSSVASHFGNLGNALEAAGLKRVDSTQNFKGRAPELVSNDLFQSILDVEKQVGHEPRMNEYIAGRRFSVTPFKRFGKWSDAHVYYRKWKAEGGTQSDGAAKLSGTTPDNSSRRIAPLFQTNNTPAQLYGEPIDFRGLRHAPINEQGVVYLFGMVSRELGFYIEAIQQGFPDCEGKYLHHAGRNLWAKARIEFEFKASSFREHGHDASQCDFIVCWVNDWLDCPIRVIELRSEILRLSAK